MANKIARPTTLEGWKKEATRLRRQLGVARKDIAFLNQANDTLGHRYDEALESIEYYRGQLAQEKKSWISRLFSSKL